MIIIKKNYIDLIFYRRQMYARDDNFVRNYFKYIFNIYD